MYGHHTFQWLHFRMWVFVPLWFFLFVLVESVKEHHFQELHISPAAVAVAQVWLPHHENGHVANFDAVEPFAAPVQRDLVPVPANRRNTLHLTTWISETKGLLSPPCTLLFIFQVAEFFWVFAVCESAFVESKLIPSFPRSGMHLQLALSPCDETSLLNKGERAHHLLLLMEEILNNHLGCIKPINNGINYQPQLVSQISEPSTVVATFYLSKIRELMEGFKYHRCFSSLLTCWWFSMK